MLTPVAYWLNIWVNVYQWSMVGNIAIKDKDFLCGRNKINSGRGARGSRGSRGRGRGRNQKNRKVDGMQARERDINKKTSERHFEVFLHNKWNMKDKLIYCVFQPLFSEY